MDGRKRGSDFGIRTYFDMFQKMEDTFKFCAECKKLPDALPDPKSLRRCKRYRGGGVGLGSWAPSRASSGGEAGGGTDPAHPQGWAHCLSPPRCQNVYYCGVACQRANWPLHKKFCKKLKLVALDRLVEWLVFTGGAGGTAPTPQPIP